jgi:hypothetical protein
VEAGDDVGEQGFAGDFFPRLVAGDADEKLGTVATETVAEREAEEF